MRTTKEERARTRKWASHPLHRNNRGMLDGVKPEMLLAILDDADEADAMRAVIVRVWKGEVGSGDELNRLGAALAAKCAEEVGRG